MAVTVLSADQTDDVSAVLCDAFFDYPVMRYVLGGHPHYPRRLRTLVGLFVATRDNPNSLMLGVNDKTGTMVAGAMVDLPGERPVSPSLEALRESVWGELGADAQSRYAEYGRIGREHAPHSHHHHLGMIGVRAKAQGTGLGRVLLEYVHGLAEADPNSTGVSLTTELERNVPLYEHFGYEVSAYARVAPKLETWAMFRPCP
jgi:GNAT superfamily N-acetyltransferase